MPIESAAELQASSSLFGKECVDANLAFYEQKKKNPDPQACEAAGKDVLACWETLRAKIKAKSEASFQAYAECLEMTGNNLKKCANLHEDLLKSFYESKE